MSPQSDSAFDYLGMIASVAFFGYLAWLYIRALKMKPRFVPTEVVFQEWFASGCSQKNILTRLGSARNCLRLVVTRSFLWVTTWFPFSLILPFYDLEHVIPIEAILSVRRSSDFGMSGVLVTYQDATGDKHTLKLRPKQPDAFIRSLGVKIDNEKLA
jgi:hypothetical protein